MSGARGTSSAPIARTGSTSAALGAERRTLVHRGVGLVAGCFALYALVSCFVPQLMTSTVGYGFRLGELVAATQVLVIAVGVWSHDRRARRHVDPLAQRVSQRERDGHGREFAGAGSGEARDGSGEAGSFNAFDSFRAFGERAAL